jgi:hypothetical protein
MAGSGPVMTTDRIFAAYFNRAIATPSRAN